MSLFLIGKPACCATMMRPMVVTVSHTKEERQEKKQPETFGLTILKQIIEASDRSWLGGFLRVVSMLRSAHLLLMRNLCFWKCMKQNPAAGLSTLPFLGCCSGTSEN